MSERSEIGGRFSLFLEASPVKLRSDFNKDREDRVEYICSNSGVINAYFCGFTAFYPEEKRSVYMPIEKLRIYVMYDLLVRVLRNSGYEVNHVMNITDVATSKWQESQDSKVLEKEFFLLFSALSLEEPSVICRASEHISDMVLLIDELTSKGYTYVYDNNQSAIHTLFTNTESIKALNDSVFEIVAGYGSLTKILNATKKDSNPTGEKTPYDKIKTTLTTAGNQLNQALESGIDTKLLAMVQESINHLQEVINQARAKSTLNYKTSAKKAA